MWSAILRDAAIGHRGLVLFALACLACAFASVGLMLVDPAVVNGAPAWHKPFKFFVSGGIYAFTFAWYLGQDERRGVAPARRGGWGWWLGTGIWVSLTIELALIAMQARRGVASHFNISTSLDASVFSAMGAMILFLTLIHLALWIGLLRARWADRTRLAACRWGAGIALLGLAVGGLMVRPGAAQLAAARAGRPVTAGAHAVGIADGGPGLPFVNWSTEAGDLRVGHFVGLHAMQVLPAVALLAPLRWPMSATAAAVRTTGLAYATLTALLILQAQQARPLLRPGRPLAAALLLTGVVWTIAMTSAHTRGSPRRH